MDAVLATLDQILDLDKSWLAGVADVPCTFWREPHVVHSEDDGVEKGLVRVIEGTVDKDISVIILGSDDSWHEVQPFLRFECDFALVHEPHFQERLPSTRPFEADSLTASLTA